MSEQRNRIRNVVKRLGPSRVSDTRSKCTWRRGASLEHGTSLQLTELGARLRTQRRKTESLLARSAMLRSWCLLLGAETKLLWEGTKQSCKTLAGTFSSINGQRCELCGPSRQSGSERTDLENIAAPRDLVAALEDATEILKMEFFETEGSGRQTLVKCEDALRRAHSVRTLILPLY